MRRSVPLAAEGDELREMRYRLRLKRDFVFYAEQCLRIRSQTGEIIPLKLRASQRFVNERLEQQKRETGKVRGLILKSRQVGISTMLDARCYWIVSHNKGMRAYILAHEDSATQALFDMAFRFHLHVPDPIRPSTGAANAKELIFDKLDSGYKVATAGNKAAGRGHTIQVFHGSEIGFWPNAAEHMAGIMQAIADVEGSEAYLESTANGIGNTFHTLWGQAERGEVDWIPIFVPWYWHETYRRPVPISGFRPSDEWREYQEIFELDEEQLFWAYRKNAELLTELGTSGSPDIISPKFKQEFPGTAAQAFETSGANAFINPLKVLKARKSSIQGNGPIILGVDPARGGKDKSGIVDRQGRRIGGHVCKRVDYGENTMALAADVKREVIRLLPLGLKKVCVDTTGLGGPLYDRLRETLPDAEKLLEPVNFAESALDPKRYVNRRTEIWDRKREWYEDVAGVRVPDSDEFQADECAPIVAPNATHFRSSGQLALEGKDKIKERIKLSPDLGDAAALTFAPDMAQIFAKERSRGRSYESDYDSGSSWGA